MGALKRATFDKAEGLLVLCAPHYSTQPLSVCSYVYLASTSPVSGYGIKNGFGSVDVAVLLEVGAELIVHIELILGGQLPRERHHPCERDRTWLGLRVRARG